jgi:hypothetical protein
MFEGFGDDIIGPDGQLNLNVRTLSFSSGVLHRDDMKFFVMFFFFCRIHQDLISFSDVPEFFSGMGIYVSMFLGIFIGMQFSG